MGELTLQARFSLSRAKSFNTKYLFLSWKKRAYARYHGFPTESYSTTAIEVISFLIEYRVSETKIFNGSWYIKLKQSSEKLLMSIYSRCLPWAENTVITYWKAWPDITVWLEIISANSNSETIILILRETKCIWIPKQIKMISHFYLITKSV